MTSESRTKDTEMDFTEQEKEIEELGEVLLIHFRKICGTVDRYGIYIEDMGLFGHGYPLTKELEEKGYLVSREISRNYIAVVPKKKAVT